MSLLKDASVPGSVGVGQIWKCFGQNDYCVGKIDKCSRQTFSEPHNPCNLEDCI